MLKIVYLIQGKLRPDFEGIESVAVVSCFVVLFYIIYNHLFEYK